MLITDCWHLVCQLAECFLRRVETESTWYADHYLAYCTSPGWWMMTSVEQSVEWLVENQKYSEKTYPSVALSTTNPTWLDAGSNQGRLGGNSGLTPELRYGLACRFTLYSTSYTVLRDVGVRNRDNCWVISSHSNHTYSFWPSLHNWERTLSLLGPPVLPCPVTVPCYLTHKCNRIWSRYFIYWNAEYDFCYWFR
jgi:hypothetical protein